jgi:glycosyltransferase involved in cell wall biosynthesis
MRVLCITNLFPNPAQPGKGIFNWKQLRLLTQQASVRVISPVAWTDELRGRFRGTTAFCDRNWREWEGIAVAWCRYFYTPRVLRRHYGSFLKASLRLLVRRTIAEFQPDLIYACWAYPDGWAAARLGHEFNLPVVLKVHGSDLFLLDKFPARKLRTAEALQGADAVLGVGQALCDTAVGLGARREGCHVVREGVDPEMFFPGDRATARRELWLAPEHRRLLFVGNLVPVKAVSNLIEACGLLIREGFPVEADIIGDGPLRDELQKQIEELGLCQTVFLRGRRPAAHLPRWYRAADVFVLPSESEGVPNVLIESAACGIPFVATRVGCIPEIADLVRSELVQPHDPNALARGIQAVLADPGFDRGGPRLSSVPSVAGGVERTMQIFSEVLSRRRGAPPVIA